MKVINKNIHEVQQTPSRIQPTESHRLTWKDKVKEFQKQKERSDLSCT